MLKFHFFIDEQKKHINDVLRFNSSILIVEQKITQMMLNGSIVTFGAIDIQ